MVWVEGRSLVARSERHTLGKSRRDLWWGWFQTASMIGDVAVGIEVHLVSGLEHFGHEKQRLI
ncbi:MAG: hypothetical protein ACKVH7_15935 [Alphaproteobacteria bacterium]|jgi:hypothetical protein